MKGRIKSVLNGLKWSVKTRFRVLSLNFHPSAQIGEGCIIKRGSSLSEGVCLGEGVELYRRVVLGKDVKVGAYTSINDSTVVECGTIGRLCSLGVDVVIGPGVHPLNHFTTSTLALKRLGVVHYEFTPPPPPLIGDDVWVGSRAIVMRGVTIGQGAVIGAGSVVTKDVPPYAIVAGVPSKIVKYRFDEEMRNKLLSLHLFDNYKENIVFIKRLLSAGNKFVDCLY